MTQLTEPGASPVSRKLIAFRLLYTVLFLFVLGILLFLIKLATVFNYILLLITRSHSEPVRRFANQVATYAYYVMRYLTLNDNERPYPFTDFPGDLKAPVEEVTFD